MSDLKITGQKAASTGVVSCGVILVVQIIVKFAEKKGIVVDSETEVLLIAFVSAAIHGIYDGMINFIKHFGSGKGAENPTR